MCFFRCLTFLSHYSLILTFTLISHSLCLNNFHPFSFFSFSQHLSFFLSDLLLVFPSFLSCFLYSNLIWSLSSKDDSCFFFLNLVYFLIMCLADFFTLSSSVVEIQENEVVDIRGMITFFLWLFKKVLFSQIILNVCGVYICLTREKNVWRYLLWWPHVYVFAKLNGRCAFETPPSSLYVILSLNTTAKRFEWILITFFRSIDWGHVNNPLFSHCYVYQGLQFNDLLVKKKTKPL